VHPAASTNGKQWEDDRFAAVCAHLWQRHGLASVFTGAPGDRGRYDALVARLATAYGPAVRPPVNFAGRTGLRIDIAIYRRARLFVGVDSGPMHMAVACRVPTVALFGPTDPRQWGPYQVAVPPHARAEVVTSPVACGDCRHDACPDRRCMRGIATDSVLAAIERRLGSPVGA
jgi:ADP-heptose:LPS heptosyltransferase